MALVVYDRVQETTATTGTGTITLGGAVSGFQTFAAVGNGNTTFYCIVNGSQWEVGVGTYSTTGPTLARTTILSNSGGNTSPITLSGSSNVFVTYPAERSVNLDGAGTTLPLANVATTGFKTATFNSQTTIATTTGSITVDWTTAQNQLQTEPTGTITYTFTAPPGPGHLQLIIDSDGVSTAQTINWPGNVTWMGTTWAGVNNKKAVINFWFDGTNYIAVGTNQA